MHIYLQLCWERTCKQHHPYLFSFLGSAPYFNKISIISGKYWLSCQQADNKGVDPEKSTQSTYSSRLASLALSNKIFIVSIGLFIIDWQAWWRAVDPSLSR